MRRLYECVCAILLSLSAIATMGQSPSGTLTGVICDEQGPLVGASVFLISDRETQEIAVFGVSDEEGQFSISCTPGSYILGVSFLGYELYFKEIQLTQGETNIGKITLEESAKELQMVVVQGNLLKVRTQPDGFSVNVSDLREFANDALDLLKMLPKVQVKDNQLSVIGKTKVLVKVGNVLQRVETSEVANVLKGYDASLIERVEVITQPPLRYDPDGNTAMIVLHTVSVFKEYFGGVIGSEEMYGGEYNYRYGGYGSLLYNHKGLFASIAPSSNFNASDYEEKMAYVGDEYQYKSYTPSKGKYNFGGLRGTLQYEYSDKKLFGVTIAWNKKSYDNQFDSEEITASKTYPERVVINDNGYKATEPRFTTTAYWETNFKEKCLAWAELSYYHLANDALTKYQGKISPEPKPFLIYSEKNELKTSGISFNNDYTIFLDSAHKYLLDTGVKVSWTSTNNLRAHEQRYAQWPYLSGQRNRIEWEELMVIPYISSTLHINDYFWLRLGVRYVRTKSQLQQLDNLSPDIPDVSRSHDAWLPTIHTSYTFDDRHQLTLLLNSAIIHPKFQDLNPFVWQISEHTFYRGNIELKPQIDYTASLGYTYAGALSLKGRIRKGNNVIVSVSTLQGNDVYTQVENAQNNLFTGIEAGYYFDKWSWLTFSIDGYYGRNTYTSNSKHLLPKAVSNEWGLNGYLDFAFNKSRTWTGYIAGDYVGRTKTTIATVEPQYNLDLGMSFYMLNRRLALSVAGLYLLNSGYNGVSYRDGYSISFNNNYDNPTLYFSISYKFSDAKDRSTYRSQRATRDIERRF